MNTYKTNMKLIVLSFLLCVSSVFATNFHVPQDWYQLPEKEGSYQTSPYSSSATEESFIEALDEIINANKEVVTRMENDRTSALSVPYTRKDWRLASFTNDLSITLKGGLGVLSTSGTGTARLYWRPRPEFIRHESSTVTRDLSAEKEPRGEEEEELPTVYLSPEMSHYEVSEQVEPMIKMVASTGKIQNLDRLREELYKSVKEFSSMTRAFESAKYYVWYVSRYRVDLSVNASGHVYPGVAVGADVRLRLEWHRIRRKNSRSVNYQLSRGEKSLKEFVEVISSDLKTVSNKFYNNKGFYPHTIRVGVGLSLKGNIGVAKVAGSVTGQIYFSQNVPKPSDEVADDWWPFGPNYFHVIEDAPSEASLKYARKIGVRYEVIKKERNGKTIEQVVYKISRDRFRKGLERAAKMGLTISDRAAKASQNGKWGIYELRIAFDLSLGGSLGLVDLTGLGTAQMAMYNSGFKPQY